MRPSATAIAFALLAAVGVLGGGGCKHHAAPAEPPPRLELGAITVRDLTTKEDEAVPLDVDAVREALRARLLGSGLFAAGAPDAASLPALDHPVVRVRCDVQLAGAEVERKALARAVVRLRFDTRPSDSPQAVEEDLRGQGEQVYAALQAPRPERPGERGAGGAGPRTVEREALFAKLALRVAGDLIDGFVARARLHGASPELVRAALHGDAGELREEAIRIAGERKLRDEVPALLALLDDPSEATRDAALGALIEIGDRRAVTALAKSRSLHDRREMRKILEAIATLGGDEALDYLSFIAQSHDDEEIRELATAAKSRLERRRKAVGQADPPP